MKKRLTLAAMVLGLAAGLLQAQTVTTFEGMDASQIQRPEYDVDPNGAVGTKQFMEWVNVSYQAYDKVTNAPVWPTPRLGVGPWSNNGLSVCNTISGDGAILFDRLANRWVIAAHSTNASNYNYCVAVSSTDDLASPSLQWYTYAFPLNSALGMNHQGKVYFPDWPHIGTWSDGYYVAMDVTDLSQNGREVGVLICALDRTNMLENATARTPICFEEPNPVGTAVYLGHSVIPVDFDGTTPPPSGRDAFLVSIQNPVLDGKTTTSSSFNLWDFHTDWTTPSNSSLTESSVVESSYQPACYTPGQAANTICVPEPSTSTTHQFLDSVGDRFMARLSYRNFGSYESFLVSHAVQPSSSSTQTAVRWYELRASGSGTPSLYQDGNINPDNTTYRFMPSIAEDATGNAAVGYSVSSSTVHPGMKASYFSLASAAAPTEINLYSGVGDEENTYHMGDVANDMTVDPEDGCTFWYVNVYFPTNQTGTQTTWGTRISHFALPSCGNPTISPSAVTYPEQTVATTSAPQTVTLINSLSVALNINSIGFTGTDPGDFATPSNTCGSSVPAGGSCTINVTFTPAATGTRTATLQVFDSAPNSPQTVSLTGIGGTPVTLSTTSLRFGSVPVGTRKNAPAVILTNNQSVTLTGISVTITGSKAFTQVNSCSTSVPANGTCKILVTFAPTTTGSQTATLNIVDSATNSPQTISLQGYGQ